jgi:uncharacterized protein (TIGR00369 family)
MGTLHKGILCDIVDAAMGIAFASTLAPEESVTTVELKINFFRSVWQAQLKEQGMVVRRGQTISYLEPTITDEENRLAAKGASPEAAHSNSIKTISGLVPTRIGGPQVPTPLDV